MNCIFCKLTKDNSKIIYETTKTAVLLDRYPLGSGHLLVIPKIHCDLFHKCSLEYIQDVMKVIQFIIKKYGYEKYNLLQNNRHLQSVYHLHFHIVPNGNLKIDWKTIEMSEEVYQREINEAKIKLN